MIRTPSITLIKKYLAAMNKCKAKYITAERLSRVLGVYPEIISENLSFFDPIINMDYEYDLSLLIPVMEEYVNRPIEKKSINRNNIVTHKTLNEFSSIGDFIYKKMTIGGMFDPNLKLTDKELRILKKLIIEEQAKRKDK